MVAFNSKKKSILGFTIICIALVAGIFLYHSYAFFTDENTFNSFRGNVTNNYVRFGTCQTDYYNGYVSDNNNNEAFTSLSACEGSAGSDNCTKYASAGDDMYWQIIRINGDGTMNNPFEIAYN